MELVRQYAGIQAHHKVLAWFLTDMQLCNLVLQLVVVHEGVAQNRYGLVTNFGVKNKTKSLLNSCCTLETIWNRHSHCVSTVLRMDRDS